MRAVEALLVLGLCALALYAAVAAGRSLTTGLRRRRARLAEQRDAARGWRVVIDKQDQVTVVQLEKPGEDPYIVGSAPFDLPAWEYEERLAALRLEGEDKANALNRRLG